MVGGSWPRAASQCGRPRRPFQKPFEAWWGYNGCPHGSALAAGRVWEGVFTRIGRWQAFPPFPKGKKSDAAKTGINRCQSVPERSQNLPERSERAAAPETFSG
eukprot:6748910-Pyramimonas_sp.AAC.1